jgi:excisionase family DNA binding protein
MRRELEPVLDLTRTLAPAELPAFLGELEQIRVTALARITTPPVEARPDELLEVPEAAHRLGVSPDYLYRHSKRFPFTRRTGRKLLFSSAGLDAYLRKSR